MSQRCWLMNIGENVVQLQPPPLVGILMVDPRI